MNPPVASKDSAPDSTDLEIDIDGHAAGLASVTQSGDQVTVRFSVAGGHLPVTLRPDLVAAAFDLPQLRSAHVLRVALPAGDVELLIGVRDHAAVTDVHVAGATCLVEASTD